jgi:hypothetical protein
MGETPLGAAQGEIHFRVGGFHRRLDYLIQEF